MIRSRLGGVPCSGRSQDVAAALGLGHYPVLALPLEQSGLPDNRLVFAPLHLYAPVVRQSMCRPLFIKVSSGSDGDHVRPPGRFETYFPIRSSDSGAHGKGLDIVNFFSRFLSPAFRALHLSASSRTAETVAARHGQVR